MNIFIVVEGVSEGEPEIYHGAFFSQEKAKGVAIQLSKKEWSECTRYTPGIRTGTSIENYLAGGGVISHPYANKEDSWYAEQNFRVEEVEIKDEQC